MCVIFPRNSPVLCDVFPQVNMQLWKTDTPALQVPEAILIQTLEKGTQGLARRRKEEFKLWENSKFITSWYKPINFVYYLPNQKNSLTFLSILEIF